jgi:nucleotide-binding universal stress UspA family protein
MLPIQTILHPTDFSDTSEHAFHLACALARDYGARLIAVHVRSQPTLLFAEALPYAESDFLEAEERLYSLQAGPEVHLDYLLLDGEPSSTIVTAAQDHHADLIVMGMRGRRGIARLFMGSVAEQVLRRAECPVMTVKTPFANAAQSVVGAAIVEAVT